VSNQEAKTVSDVIIAQLAAWGVEHIFGLPGDTNLRLIEAVRRQDKVKLIRVRHEEVAALAASAYAKLTGKIGVCLTIAGPGATNLITGLYDAKMDRAPVLAITGQVKLPYIGPGSFQEIDQDALFEPVSVFNKAINSKEQTVELVTLALKHALTGRAVAHLAVPKDTQIQPLETKVPPLTGHLPDFSIQPSPQAIDQAVRLIDKSQKSVIIAGWGARGESQALLQLAQKITAPVATTFRAKGIIPENHPLSLGVLGDVGTPQARQFVNEADLLLVFGSSFSDKTNIPTQIPIIQVDIDPIHIAKIHPITLGLWGDCALVLPQLTAKVVPKRNEARLQDIKLAKQAWYQVQEKGGDPEAIPIRPPYIMKVLEQVLPDDAIISLDVGDNAFWFGRNFEITHQKLLMSGYLATMGFGLPGALAAKIVSPDKSAICLTGDGGFTQVMGDFLTAVENDLPITVVILNNRELAMITVEQKVEGYPKFATDLTNPNFKDYAESCGGVGFKVDRPEELRTALEAALRAKKPAIVDINTDPRRF